MQVVILHLSDAHFKSVGDPVANRSAQIKAAILAKYPVADACFLVFSGDIANTGAIEEYAVAKRFLNELRSSLIASGMAVVEIVMVPGNHDCNFRNEIDTRKFVLDSLDKFLSTSIDFDGFNFQAVMAVQSAFFQLEAEIAGRDVLPERQQLYYRRTFVIQGRSFVFHCFNTAWLSRKHEIQSALYIPAEVLDGSTTADAPLSVAVFHHPYNWLNAVNYQHLKTFVELQADIILTGHEHLAEGSKRMTLEGAEMDYFAAPALHDPTMPENGFQLISCDLDNEKQFNARFAWTGDRYSEISCHDWHLSRNPARPADPFRNSSEFFEYLTSVGTGFRHPRRTPPSGQLVLRDLYVYPDLRHRSLDKIISGNMKRETVRGEEICNTLETDRWAIIQGTDHCGKTSLAKILYEDFRDRHYIPLFLTGEELKGCVNVAGFRKVVEKTCARQYSPLAVEPYLQADSSRKIIIVDDFHKAKLNRKNQKAVLDAFSVFFGYGVVLVSDLFNFQQLTRASDQSSGFAGYEHYDIKEFGKFHRNRLIERWLYLGLENTVDPETLLHRVTLREKTIATLLGKNVLPHHPVTILTLLQALEAKSTPNTANGAYGYLYEVLIKTALATATEEGASDVDLKVTYLSGLAYWMFTKKQTVISKEEFKTMHQQYCQRYDISREFSQMDADLRKAEILIESSGGYRFKYPYIFYYSIAKYFQENPTSTQQELLELADYIYNETNANVLIFYVYLTKDPVLIKHLTANAELIYDEYDPCDMVSQVEFLNKLYTQEPAPLTLPSTDPRKNRDEYNRKQDENAEQQEGLQLANEIVDFKYDRQLQDAIKVNIAFKTLQILGQILRNFPGSLEGELKLKITRECYALGMRTLTALLTLAKTNLEGIRAWVSELIAERTGLSDRDLAGRADKAILWLTMNVGIGSIKRISYAVGHQELMPTYAKVLAITDNLSTRMIDATVKLDHFEGIPEADLRRLRQRVKDNLYAYTIFREIVGGFLYLNNVDYPSMQTLGAMWEIKVSEPMFLANRAKKN